MHDLVCKPSAGKRHARFDERLLETERWLGVRHWRFAKAASNSFPHCPYSTAPVVDSTPEVETYPIPNGINPSAIAHFSHGKKQQLFHSGVGDLIGTSLYFDLDVIIVDSIDCFFDFKPGEFCVCREWLPPIRDYSTNWQREKLEEIHRYSDLKQIRCSLSLT